MDSSVEEERRLALDRLKQMQQFYERPEAAQLLQQFQQRASGADSPFTQQVQNNQFADNADASAGQVRSERGMIDRSFANAGLAGSGLQASAHINSQRRASAMARQGRRDITSRAALANYQAREAAQQQVQSYLQQMNQSKMQAGMAEVGFREQAREVTQEPVQAQGQAPALGQPNRTPGAVVASSATSDPYALRMTNNQVSYGGTPTGNSGGFAPMWQANGWGSPQQGQIMKQFGF